MTRRARRWSPVLASFLAACALAGCGAPGASVRDYSGLPAGLDGSDVAGELLDEPAAVLLDDGRVLAVTTWGSSSCHRVAESIDWDGTTVTIRFGTAGGPMCTADMAARTHEFDVPDGASGRPLELELTYTDWDGTTELTVE